MSSVRVHLLPTTRASDHPSFRSLLADPVMANRRIAGRAKGFPPLPVPVGGRRQAPGAVA